jgi:3-hydroxyacyl-CoA dehydrogenase/enoyl-CoA hydratase/3-hydroxybutyryl-CoA epimerase
MQKFQYQKDADGIVTLTMDMEGPVNAMNSEFRQALSHAVACLESETGLRGVVLTPPKKCFWPVLTSMRYWRLAVVIRQRF